MNGLTCAAGTTRRGELEPCGKPAVTWADPEPWQVEFGPDIEPWPICAWHAHMGTALPLERHPKENKR